MNVLCNTFNLKIDLHKFHRNQCLGVSDPCSAFKGEYSSLRTDLLKSL